MAFRAAGAHSGRQPSLASPPHGRHQMATAPQLEIKCGTCGFCMPAPAAATAPPADASAYLGTTVQCRKCLQRTTCTTTNMRLRAEDGVVA